MISRHRPASAFSHESSDLFQASGPTITGQAIKEELAVLLADEPVVENGQDTAVVSTADQAPKSLLQRDHGLRDLIISEGVATVFVDLADSGGDDRIGGHREGQAVNDHRAELLSLYVYALPERAGGEEDGMRGGSEAIKQRGARSGSLQ